MTCLRRNGSVVSSAAAAASSSLRQLAGAAARVSNLSAQTGPDCGKASVGGGQNIMEDFLKTQAVPGSCVFLNLLYRHCHVSIQQRRRLVWYGAAPASGLSSGMPLGRQQPAPSVSGGSATH